VQRSYESVADQLGVSEYAVAKLAQHERWQARVAERERAERDAQESRIIDQLVEQRLRPLIAKLEVRSKKLDLVSGYRITSGLDAIEVALIAMHMERLILVGQDDLADELVNLLILRMHNTGQIDRATALSALGVKGEAA
jgi:hypothetical protein